MPTLFESKLVRGGGVAKSVTTRALDQTVFDTDAHWAPYDVTEGGPRRVTLAMLAECPVVLGLFVADVDCFTEAPTEEQVWNRTTPIAWVAWLQDVVRDHLRTGPWTYLTRSGARIVWRIPPVTVDGPEAAGTWKRAYIDRLLALYAATGIVGDPACSDCVRLYRAPHVVRDGMRLWGDNLGGYAESPGAWTYESIEGAERLTALASLAAKSAAWNQVFERSLSLPSLPAVPLSTRGPKSTDGAVRRAVAMVTDAPKGTRNRALHAAAGFLRRLTDAGELGESQARGALTDAAIGVGLERGEVARTLNGVWRQRA